MDAENKNKLFEKLLKNFLKKVFFTFFDSVPDLNVCPGLRFVVMGRRPRVVQPLPWPLQPLSCHF